MLRFLQGNSLRVGLLALCLAMVAWVSAQSQEAENSPKAPANSPPKTNRPMSAGESANVIMTPERQAAALKFAELHHPELHQLIQGLKRGNRPEYQKAVRQLYSDSERLARLKERAPDRYELALAEWQTNSRLRLLVARMTMSTGDPELEAQLDDLLQKRLDARLNLLKFDRERHAARLAKMDEQIEQLESDREVAIQKELAEIQRSLGVNKPKPKRIPASAPKNP